MIDVGVDQRRRTEVVARQADDDAVGFVDFLDQLVRQAQGLVAFIVARLTAIQRRHGIGIEVSNR
ncbi:hypothetical protein D3C80_1982250 [compost metagenome]